MVTLSRLKLALDLPTNHPRTSKYQFHNPKKTSPLTHHTKMPTRLTKTRKQYAFHSLLPALYPLPLTLSQPPRRSQANHPAQSRPRIRRPRPRRQAPQASRRARHGGRAAPSPDQSGQVPPGLFRQSGHAVFPQAAESVLETGHQFRQGGFSFLLLFLFERRCGKWDIGLGGKRRRMRRGRRIGTGSGEGGGGRYAMDCDGFWWGNTSDTMNFHQISPLFPLALAIPPRLPKILIKTPRANPEPKKQLWSLIPLEKRDQYLADKDGETAPVLDLLPLGYSKVLGKGRLPEIPIVVRARYFSREAERKIKEAGGVVELVA